jgi:shikimate kinase
MKDLLRGLNIYLIGMMGAGKTTVGKLLAEKLQYRFIDTDNIIEAVSQKSINQIFAEEGESVFRQLETDVLVQVSAYLRTVIATGGGIVLRSNNWSYLQEGMVIYLDVPVDLLVKRLADDQTRPLLQTEDFTTKLTKLQKERESLYQQADLTISVTATDQATDIVEKIIAEIPSKIKPPFSLEEN